MILELKVETPEDDHLYYPRVALALIEYLEQVERNHNPIFGTRETNLGCDGGPNVFLASNGVKVREHRTQ